MNLSITEFFIHLLSTHSLYARLAGALHRVSRPGLNTIAVGICRGRISLYYDPAFIAAVPMGAAVFILEHEMLHLMLDHIPRYLEALSRIETEEDRRKAGRVYNIAMDCAVNSLLREHKHFEVTEAFTIDWGRRLDEKRRLENESLMEALKEAASREGLDIVERSTVSQEDTPQALKRRGMCLPAKYDLPDAKSFEFYLDALSKEDPEDDGSSCHDLWTSSDEDETSDKGEGTLPTDAGVIHRIREQLRHLLRGVLQTFKGSSLNGLVPSEVEEFLRSYTADPIIAWWMIFSTRAKTSQRAKNRRSASTPNRALLALAEEDHRIIPSPGRTRDMAWRVFLMTDTSGSMSTQSLEIVRSELRHMLAASEGMEIRLLEGDAAVHRDVLVRAGDEFPDTVIGRGGTDFDAYFTYMMQYVHDEATRPDIVIVYTDGYAPGVQEANRLPLDIPVIWLLTPEHSRSSLAGYGEVIVCDSTHNGLYGQ